MMKQFTNKRWLNAAMVMTIGGTMLAGCSTSTLEQKNTSVAADTGVPTPIQIMSIGGAETPKENSEVLKEIEKMTNTKLTITWVPDSAYVDKANATLASGELPQVMYTNAIKSPNIMNAINAGAFWEIGPYLKEFPNLNKLDPDTMSSLAIDNKQYLLIRTRDSARHVVAYRKDWLTTLELQEPKTLDDLYKVAKAFTENDPDKNGKNDTYGFTEINTLDTFNRNIAVYHGAPLSFGITNNALVPSFSTPEYLEGLKFYRKLFAEKIMNPDFVLINSKQRMEMMTKGKAGIIIAPDSDLITIQKDAVKLDPKAEFAFLQGFTGPKGLKVSGTGGYLGGFLFAKNSIKTEAELKKILGFFDKISTQEGMTLLSRGIKDVDYKLVDGFVTPIPERSDGRIADGAFNNLAVLHQNVALPLKRTPVEDKVFSLVEANNKIAIFDMARAFNSQTKAEKGAQLDKTINDARIKYIMGEIDESGYLKAVELWNTSGGNQVMKELNEEYQKSLKK
ncbi:putative aldouronate transport system substrate-binding protein [Paenibacillus sp. 1_12]|uniref:extracellular solute-binding protein n=1 Tax=Paenibacillus sp. 1_12 TaxID=1566278 RepID=UPI0008EB257E|nr:extracellular solute-binding protein [Paenibacillus sp. 1_12]SFL58393.1 putative aldouronate transport system substrate-binding protein [Paenibacillus sp. 1_12]